MKSKSSFVQSDGQTDRQTDRQTGWLAGRQTDIKKYVSM